MYTDIDFVTMVRTIEHELMNDEEWRKPSEGREVISIEVQQSASVETRTQTWSTTSSSFAGIAESFSAQCAE